MGEYPRGRVPKARIELAHIASELDDGRTSPEEAADAIRHVVSTLLYRRPVAKPTARATARKMTGALVLAARAAVAAQPTRSNRSIGRMLGIDGGRVSESIQGLRCPITGDLLDEPSPWF